MTGQDIITEVRRKLLDESTPYRWSDAELLDALNDGLNALYSRRPDCVLLEDDETVRLDRPAPLGELGDPVPLETRWRPSLVYYVLSRAYEDDSDDIEAGAEGRVQAYLAKFEAEAARA